MKVLGIYIGPYYSEDHWDENTVMNGIGGTETWAYEVGLEFSKRNYKVYLYGQPEVGHWVNENFYIGYHDEINTHIMERMKFDYFIFIRHCDKVSPWINCDNIYCMVHDIHLYHNRSTSIGISSIKKYGVLSQYHWDEFLERYRREGITEDRLFRVTNGFSKQFYQNPESVQKTNSMVWSSGIIRGFFPIYENVLWPVIKEFPDFKIHLGLGTPRSNEMRDIEKAKMLPNVIFHGTLSKEKLAQLQMQSKVWVYPGFFPETFCITAVENAQAGNALICPPTYGLASTLEGYEYFCNPINDKLDYSEYREKLHKVLSNDEYRNQLANSAMNVTSKYSWQKAADDWETEFSKCNEIPDTGYIY